MAGQEYWEFLLQQEGDRTWLPLESPTVEILEGRYRVMVRSSYRNAELEVRITHEATEEMPPKRRTQRRVNRTSWEGLLVVIPFTMLRPGIWELNCSSGVMTELMGTSCHYSVHLHVLPKELDSAGDWDPDWQQSTPIAAGAPHLEVVPNLAVTPAPEEVGESAPAAETQEAIARSTPTPGALHESVAESDESLLADLSATLDDLDFLSELPSTPDQQASVEALEDVGLTEQADQADDQAIGDLQDWDAGLSDQEEAWIGDLGDLQDGDAGLTEQEDAWIDDMQAEAATPQTASLEYSTETVIQDLPFVRSPDLEALPPLTLNLRSDSYEVQAGITLSLYGEVQVERACVLSDADLRTVVRDPQTGTIVLQQAERWQLRSLPQFFQVSLPIPDPLPAQLMLGEVEIFDRASQVVLTKQSFSLTANLEDLLANIALHPIEVELDPVIPQITPEVAPVDSAFVDFIQTPPPNLSSSFQATSGSTMPPQLYTPDPNREDRRSLDLPNFVKPAPPDPIDDVDDLFADLTGEALPDMADFPMTLPDEEMGVLSEDDLLAEVPILEEEMLGGTLEDALPEHLFTSNDNTSVEDPLNDADLLDPDLFEIDAEDAVQTIDVAATPLPDGFESLNVGDRFMNRLNALAEDTQAEIQAATPKEPTAPINPFAAPTGQGRSGHQEVVLEDFNPFVSAPTLGHEPNPLKIPEDQSIPTPKLEIETLAEVVAGQSLLVKVKLPNLLAKLYVKLWINDRQTRTLLDGPRYLIDFVPNGHDELETITQLTVPMGSLEIQLEAIAIETATKRESYKATAAILVVPPNMSGFSIEDLNL